MALRAPTIATQLRALTRRDAKSLHKLRATLSKQLADEPAEDVIELAARVLELPGVPGTHFMAWGLVGAHEGAVRSIDAEQLEHLGSDLASWGDVDTFSCLLAGRAWRSGAIGDAVVKRWARSESRWWRRTALVCTVPLNVRSQGGRGDRRRTLAVCKLLVKDRDDMVVKAMSWALRELVVHDAAAVRGFLQEHAETLAPRVLREVRNKLETGLKSPRTTDRR